MSRKKWRGLVIVFFVGLYVLTWEPVILWLFAGAIVLLWDSPESRPAKIKNRDLSFQIGKTAREHGLVMPRNSVIRSLLRKIYRQYNRSMEMYPQFESDYKEVIEEMWANMATTQNVEYWKTLLTSVLENWPKNEKALGESIEKKLAEICEKTKQWNEAKSEAMGGDYA